MKSFWLAWLAAVPLHGAALFDVSESTSVMLHSGDSLVFQILTGSFGFHATSLGLDPYPAEVGFAFATAPLTAPASVSVWLESPGASVSAPFAGPLGFAPGYWFSSEYQGGVSVLQGDLQLSGEISAGIFGNGTARLVLRNDGGDLFLGLPPTTLCRDLSVSLTGGPLSVGAPAGAAGLEEQSPEPDTLFPVVLAALLIGHRARSKNQPFANS